MKKIYILFAVCVGVLLTACAREDQPEASAQGEIAIRLTVPEMPTKTTAAGTDAENTVASLDLLVYNGVAAPPVWTRHEDIASGHLLDLTYTQDGITPADLGITGTDKSALLTMTVFAVVNYPTSLESTSLTLSEVKALTVNAEAFVTGATGEGVVAADPRFIMVAEGGFDASGPTSVLADLSLKRLAAKVSLTLTYPASITTPGDDYSGHTTTYVWYPMSGENVRAYLDNAAMSATLGGPASPIPAGFTYADTHPTAGAKVDFYTYPFAWDGKLDRAPFIKIIQPWHYVRYYNDGSKDIIIDENVVEFYYKVMFPGLTSLASNTWYDTTVTVNVLGGEVESPVLLEAKGLDVLGWGTATGVDPISLQPVKYLAVDDPTVIAENGNPVSVRFMASSRPTMTVVSVEKWVYTNNGTAQVVIGPAVNNDISDHYGYEYEGSAYTPSDWVTLEFDENTHEGFVHMKHTLSGDFDDKNFAARPYIYIIRLELGSFQEDITITQYPPMYVEGQMSTGWVCINGIDAVNSSTTMTTYSATSVTYDNGYQPRTTAWPNGTSDADKPYYTYVRLAGKKAATGTGGHKAYIYLSWKYSTGSISEDAVNALGNIHTYNFLNPSGGNSSRWRIIVRPTATDGRFIMDPRIAVSSDNDLNNVINKHVRSYNAASSYAVDGSPLLPDGSPDYDKIKAYRPTGRDAKFGKYIAPEVMFASSYGKSTTVNYYDAILRCAAYQEDGFPAGRWRVPTEAEIETAIRLADKGAIPTLFNSSGKYWASSGRYYYHEGAVWKWKDDPTVEEMIFKVGTANSLGVRCVYDTWYWGKEEVTALMTDDNGKKPGCTSNISNPQYIWSEYNYTSK